MGSLKGKTLGADLPQMSRNSRNISCNSSRSGRSSRSSSSSDKGSSIVEGRRVRVGVGAAGQILDFSLISITYHSLCIYLYVRIYTPEPLTSG